MEVTAIAKDFVTLCKAGQFEEAGRKYWSPDVVSREPAGPMMEACGIPAVAAKGEGGMPTMRCTGFEIDGPYVTGDRFMVRFAMDITAKADGQRMTMDEIAGSVMPMMLTELPRPSFIGTLASKLSRPGGRNGSLCRLS